MNCKNMKFFLRTINLTNFVAKTSKLICQILSYLDLTHVDNRIKLPNISGNL